LIRSDPKTNFEVIVVDNSPKDKVSNNLKKLVDNLKYQITNENLGYGTGNNLGAYLAKGEYLLFLNPDTIVKNGAVDNLVNFLDKYKNAGIVAPNLLRENDELFEKIGSSELTPKSAVFSISFISKLFPRNKIKRKYELIEVDKNKLRQVSAVPGAAFLIRKNVFENAGKFDENIFMFFEEADLGRRVKNLGYKIFITPKSEVVHKWKSDKSNEGTLNKIFRKSRYYYFKKHFGVLSAVSLESILRINKYNILLFLIFLLSLFLRTYKLDENVIWGGELGHNYLAVKNFVMEKRLPLLGPPTSHPWLYFGPLYYWIIAPVLIFGNYEPTTVTYFFAVIFSLLIYLNYFVIKNIYGVKTALISSLLIAISPLWLQITRGSRFFSLSIILFYPFFYFFYKSLRKKFNKQYFLSGLYYGFILNFHLSAIILLPSITLLLYLYKDRIKLKNYFYMFIGIFVANLPFILHNIINGFDMITKLAVWIPYRIAGFFGFIPKNTVDKKVIALNISSLYEFISSVFSINYEHSGYLALFLFILSILYLIKNYIKNRKLKFEMLIVFFLIGYLAIFLHGKPPQHYFMPLYPVVVIIISIFISNIFKKKMYKLGIIFIFLIVYTCLYSIYKNHWFKDIKYYRSANILNYKDFRELSRYIVNDSKGRPLSIKRVGKNDKFEGDFAQGYQYLMWLYGNEPVQVGNTIVKPDKKPEVQYIIFEGLSFFPDDISDLKIIDNIAVEKNFL
jgi:GT2 family glycosyltransferase